MKYKQPTPSVGDTIWYRTKDDKSAVLNRVFVKEVRANVIAVSLSDYYSCMSNFLTYLDLNRIEIVEVEKGV